MVARQIIVIASFAIGLMAANNVNAAEAGKSWYDFLHIYNYKDKAARTRTRTPRTAPTTVPTTPTTPTTTPTTPTPTPTTSGGTPVVSSGSFTGTPSLVSSRSDCETSGTSGCVAPLAVFLNMSATTDTAFTKLPFHEIGYKCDWGDSSAGTWSNGARAGSASKNITYGPMAAHVYETPGTYTATCAYQDNSGIATVSRTIYVTDPNTVFSGSKTTCVANGTTPVAGAGGCPVGAAVENQASAGTACSNYGGTGKRVLFKRGNSFTGGCSISAAGPGIVGAFGTGSAPAYSSVSGAGTNWRFMDATLNANTTSGQAVNLSATKTLALRLVASNANIGFMTSVAEVAIVDSSFHQGLGSSSYGAYIDASKGYFAAMGNNIDLGPVNGSPTHVMRMQSASNSVVSNNTLSNAGSGYHVLKLHAFGVTYSQFNVVSDNKLNAGAAPNWVASIGPQNSTTNENVRDLIFERNWIVGGANTTNAIETSAAFSTFRNNIIDSTIGGGNISLGRRGIENVPQNDAFYNNTIYHGSGTITGISISVGTNHVAKNNLVYSPSGGNAVSGSGYTGSNNTSTVSVTPLFTGLAPITPAGAKPTRTSYAIGTGTTVPVWYDFFGTAEPAIRDLGAVMH